MSLFDLLLLALAGFAAGGMNALAGGGTFFSFPALLAAGLPVVERRKWPRLCAAPVSYCW